MTLVLVGCASVRATDLSAQLQAGTDFSADVDAAIAQFEADGFVVRERHRGETFDAVAVEDEEGRTRVRVATRKGWVLSVDAPSEHHSRPRVGLWPARADLDGDGREELLVSAHDPATDRTCAALVQIEGDGSAREVTLPLALGGDACIEGVEGGALQIGVRYPRWSRGRVPVLRFWLGGRGWLRREIIEEEAPSDASPSEMWAWAVEAAGRLHAQDASADAQVAAFDAALGTPSSERWEEARAAFVEWIRDGWRERDPLGDGRNEP